MSELTPIQCFDFRLIPRYLFDHVKFAEPIDYNVLCQVGNEALKTPFNQLWVFADDQSLIKGWMWLTISPFNRCLYITTISLDRTYQGRNMDLELAGQVVRNLYHRHQLKSVYISTLRPKAYEKKGFERSPLTLLKATPEMLEYPNGEDQGK